MRLIDADVLMNVMYHEAFETDTDMQRWDSGCWIRYKMFENCIDNAPTIDAVSVVRCQDCKYWVYNFNGCSRNPCTEPWYATDFCAYGERKEGE